MARTSDPHAAALKAWETRERKSGTVLSPEQRTAQIDGDNATLLRNQSLRDAVRRYVSSAEDINKYLRKNVPVDDRTMDAAEELLRTLPKARLPEDATLYRGVGDTGAAAMANLRPGDIFEDRGVVSTSADSRIAVEFTDADQLDAGEVTAPGYLVRIRARQGQKGLPICRQTPQDRLAVIGVMEEQETLLPPGSRFRVVKTSDHHLIPPATGIGTESRPVKVRIIDVDLLD